MTPARTRGTLPFRLITAFVLMTLVAGMATTAYSAPPRARAVTAAAPTGTAEIRGIKYHDRDFDGMRETGEEGLSGWTMILTSASRPAWQATATTAANGAFAFTGLVAGTYAITEVEEAGWRNTNGLPHYVTVRDGEIATADNEIGSVEDHAELTLTRSAFPMTYKSVGDVITFTYLVRNSGNVWFYSPFQVTDNKVSVTFANIETLRPGAVATCTANYTVTQADVEAGTITSTAVAHVVGHFQSNATTITLTMQKDPADADLLISASHYSRRRHQKVTIYTRFKESADAPFAGCEVLYQVKGPGATSWKTVAKRDVDVQTGKARYYATLNYRGTYQWRTRFMGTDDFESATSRTIRIKVTR